MPHYEYMTLPGIDSLGNRLNAPLLMKQVQSVAAQWERKRILSETFACTGNGVSFQELKKIWGYHLSFGINYPCMSISMTSLGGIRKEIIQCLFLINNLGKSIFIILVNGLKIVVS